DATRNCSIRNGDAVDGVVGPVGCRRRRGRGLCESERRSGRERCEDDDDRAHVGSPLSGARFFEARCSQRSRPVLGSQQEKRCRRSLAPALHVRRCPGRCVMNKDEMEGKVEKAKGYVKEKAGQVTDNRDLEAEGAADRAAGKTQEAMGQARRKAGEALEDLGEKIKE